MWAFSRDLALLWKGAEETGHYPYPFDVDGDGRDELFIGHGMWDHTGRQLWSRAARPEGPRRRGGGGQLHRRSESGAARLLVVERRGVPDARPEGADPEAPPRRAHADRRHRQVPRRRARAAVRHHELLEEPRDHEPLRRGGEPPAAGGADPFRQRHPARELARRRPGAGAALRQRARGRHGGRPLPARRDVPRRRPSRPDRGRARPDRRPARRDRALGPGPRVDLHPGCAPARGAGVRAHRAIPTTTIRTTARTSRCRAGRRRAAVGVD